MELLILWTQDLELNLFIMGSERTSLVVAKETETIEEQKYDLVAMAQALS